jgi:K+ transporter
VALSTVVHIHDTRGHAYMAALTLGAIGVVYGDIGTSVLYATHGRHPAWAVLLGIAGLLWWR